MNIEEFFDQAGSIIYGGDPCDLGCDESKLESISEWARNLGRNKPVCAVRKWSWIDLDIDKSDLEIFKSKGVIPSFVHGEIIFDDANRGFTSVRSTALKEFSENCLFETKNTMYILVGSGTRTKVSPFVLQSIIF